MNRADPVIEKIRNSKLNLQKEDRQALDNLVFALILNAPHGVIDKAKIREDVINRVSGQLQDAIIRQEGPINSQPPKEYFDGLMPHDYLNIAMDPKNIATLSALGLMGLQVHEGIGENFIIGDSPVLVVYGTVDGSRSLLNPGSQVILPIQRKYVLVYSWETQFNLIQAGNPLSREQVCSLNRDYYHNSSSRYIFGRTRDSLTLAREPQAQQPSPQPSAEFNDGGLLIRRQLDRIFKLREQKQQANQIGFDAAAKELVWRARQNFDR